MKENKTHYTNYDGEAVPYEFKKNEYPIWSMNDFTDYMEKAVIAHGDGKHLTGIVMSTQGLYERITRMLRSFGSDYDMYHVFDVVNSSRAPTMQAVYFEISGPANVIRIREIVSEIANNPSNYHYVWIHNDGHAHTNMKDFVSHYSIANAPDNLTLNVEGIGGRGERIFADYFANDRHANRPSIANTPNDGSPTIRIDLRDKKEKLK